LLEFADTELRNASARIDHMMNYTLIVPSTKVLPPMIPLHYQGLLCLRDRNAYVERNCGASGNAHRWAKQSAALADNRLRHRTSPL
jgi:hypothetical protein